MYDHNNDSPPRDPPPVGARVPRDWIRTNSRPTLAFFMKAIKNILLIETLIMTTLILFSSQTLRYLPHLQQNWSHETSWKERSIWCRASNCPGFPFKFWKRGIIHKSIVPCRSHANTYLVFAAGQKL